MIDGPSQPPATTRTAGGAASHPRLRWSLAAHLALFLLIFGAATVWASPLKRPRLFLILCDAITFEDLNSASDASPHLAEMARAGSIGLMNCAVPEPKSDTSALLTIATGQQARGEPNDEKAANDWEKPPGEMRSTFQLYRELMGLPPVPMGQFDPRRSVKHLGILGLKVRTFNDTRLGALLARVTPPVSCWLVGNADTAGWRRRAALLTVDEAGAGSGLVALRSYNPALPYGLSDDPAALLDYASGTGAEFVVIALGDGARAEKARAELSDTAYRSAHMHAVHELDTLVSLLQQRLGAQPADILIVSPRPPSVDAAHPTAWDHLTPILGSGPDFPPGYLTSSTTRTPGLVSNTDVAPTLLGLYGVPVPIGMTGRPMRTLPDAERGVSAEERLGRLARTDSVAWMNAASLVPALVCLGIACFLFSVIGLLLLRLRLCSAARFVALGLAAVINFPAAQLIAPVLMPATCLEYGLRIAAWMAALTAVAWGLARLARVSIPVAACALNIGAILVDLLTGQHLIKDTMISNYYLPGFRYYGLGNDYLGLMLGLAIAGSFALLDDLRPAQSRTEAYADRTDQPLMQNRPAVAPATANDEAGEGAAPQGPPRGLLIGLVLFWVALIAVFGWPAWGANAGSVIVCSTAFGTAWAVIARGKGNWWGALAAAALGFAVTLGFAYLDARLHGANSAHSGAALIAASHGRGISYLWQIAVRKVQFNLSLLSSPWTWVTLSLITGALLLAPVIAEKEIGRALRRRPWMRRSTWPCAAGAVAALLFKDSGVVTVCYLLGSAVVVAFYFLITTDPDASEG